MTIPLAVPIGTYTLVLVAEDGDIAGRTEVAVGPAAAAVATREGMPHMADGAMPGMQATGEMMDIEIHTSPAEWAVIAALILLCFGGGAALLMKSRSTTSH